MNNEKQTWFLVICKFQKYEAALFNDLAYCKQFADSKKLPYKTFHHKRDAIKSAGCPESKIKIRITEYQCWKDQYKKAFAQQKGYQVIYIDYHDIHTDHYKKIINDAILLSRN